jgi:hypothetical protein
MNYRLPFLSFILLVLFASSCKKDKDDATPSIPKIKAIIKPLSGGGNDSTLYTYNSDGNIATIYYNSSGERRVYTYTDNEVSLTTYDGTGMAQYTGHFYLNAQGLADSTYFVPVSGNPSSSRYIYNDAGSNIISRIYNPAGTLQSVYFYTEVGGNVVARADYSSTGTEISNSEFSYDQAHPNTIGEENKGFSFLGKQSDNLLTADYIRLSWGTYYYTYRYTFDSNNRVFSQIRYSALGDSAGVAYYHYY